MCNVVPVKPVEEINYFHMHESPTHHDLIHHPNLHTHASDLITNRPSNGCTTVELYFLVKPQTAFVRFYMVRLIKKKYNHLYPIPMGLCLLYFIICIFNIDMQVSSISSVKLCVCTAFQLNKAPTSPPTIAAL